MPRLSQWILKGHSGRNFAMLIVHLLQNILQTDLRLTGQRQSYPLLLQLREQHPIFDDDMGKFDQRCGRNLEI